MRLIALCLIALFAAGPAFAEEQPGSSGSRGKLFWSGLALGIAGAATSVLATTVYRVEDSSSGNAPAPTYQSCVAQKRDPIYATSNCEALKGKNVPMLWSGVAIGALGVVMMIGGTRTSAEIGPGTFRLFHTIRF
jgi:drug/metabolite transporter (DMT)-like permease